jgi:hypothetical protein
MRGTPRRIRHNKLALSTLLPLTTAGCNVKIHNLVTGIYKAVLRIRDLIVFTTWFWLRDPDPG